MSDPDLEDIDVCKFLPQADVEANFLIVKSYEFTTISSVTLLSCFTVPCVVVLSAVTLGQFFLSVSCIVHWDMMK